jgi:tetratricopeptide (TPR) repeat protein
VECLQLLSQHYILIHDFNNAEKNLLLAKEMKPNNRTIAYDIFKLYEKINDTLKVISSLKKLIAIDSLNGRHYIELAKYEIFKGNNASAQLLIEKAEQLSSRGDYLIRIAKTYRRLGNEEKFNEISRKALESGYEEKKDKYYTLIFDDDSYLVSYTKPCR